MIIPMLVVGADKYGHPLKCGDICKYTVTTQHRVNGEKSVTEQHKGMIVYNDSDFTFEFVQLDEMFPAVYMHAVDCASIEKIWEMNASNVSGMPDGHKWAELYNSELGIMK